MRTSVLASEFTGEFFGFGSRARARAYDEDNPGDPGNMAPNRARPWVMEFESLTLPQTAVPEQSSFALLSGALALGWVMVRSRQS